MPSVLSLEQSRPGIAATALAALAIAALTSTQFLFQPFVWRHWSGAEIAVAWVEILRDRVLVLGFIALAYWLAQGWRAASAVARIAATIGAAAVGALLGESVLWGLGAPGAAEHVPALLGRAVRWACVVAALAALHEVWLRTLRVDAAAREADAAQQASETQLIDQRLQALRAQIEPHFLFNTLATVQRLASTDPALGARLLDHLHTFVQLSAQTGPQGPRWTLAQELALVRAYLGVIEMRMDGRLGVTIDAEVWLENMEFPPLLLATLVENAVKHGITPLPEGGAITVTARRDGDAMQASVTDTGVGFFASGGAGIGLANSRARLRTLFGTRAWLRLAANAPQGVVATIRLPVQGAQRQ